MTRTRPEVEAAITLALAEQRDADLHSDDIAEQIAEHKLNQLLEEYTHTPLPRQPHD